MPAMKNDGSQAMDYRFGCVRNIMSLHPRFTHHDELRSLHSTFHFRLLYKSIKSPKSGPKTMDCYSVFLADLGV